MIRADVANRLQPAADLSVRPALPAQEITDKLPGLAAGQRLLAEVQALLPNGTYRALINQRSVTLAARRYRFRNNRQGQFAIALGDFQLDRITGPGGKGQRQRHAALVDQGTVGAVGHQ